MPGVLKLILFVAAWIIGFVMFGSLGGSCTKASVVAGLTLTFLVAGYWLPAQLKRATLEVTLPGVIVPLVAGLAIQFLGYC